MDYSFSPRLSINLSEPDFKLQEMIKILSTPTHLRTQNSIKFLQHYTESISLFMQMIEEEDQQIFKECLLCLRYKYLTAGSYVCKSGEKGDYFYLILDGEVGVHVLNDEKASLEQVCILARGGYFGELALLREQPRSATIQCIKNTHFATLCKNDYLRILGRVSTQKLEELISFFNSLPTFTGWSKKSLIKLSYYFRVLKFKRNQIICTEGDPAESVFIVKKGEVSIIKEIKVQRPTVRKIGHNGRLLPTLKCGNYSMKAQMSIESVGEIIGDEDILHDLPRSFTCQCYSANAELLEISKLEFKKRVRAEDSLNQLTQRQKAKNSHMTSAISLLKVIKQPGNVDKTEDKSVGKHILDSIRSLNPWNSAQSIYKKKNITSEESTKIMKKAIKGVAEVRSLPLSPRGPNLHQTLSPKSFMSYH